MSHHRHVWAGFIPLRLGRLLEEQKQFLAPGPLVASSFSAITCAPNMPQRRAFYSGLRAGKCPNKNFVLHFPQVIKRNFQYG